MPEPLSAELPRTAARRGLWAWAGLLVGLGLGFAGGWFLRPTDTAPRAESPADGTSRPGPERLFPHRPLAEQNTILIGAAPTDEETEDADGAVLLRPDDPPRVLTFHADDVDEAQRAVQRFVSALRPGLVKALGTGDAEVDGTRLLWRVEGDGAARRLRVVALPVDPYRSDSKASRLAEALGEWTIVHGVHPRTVTSFEAHLAAVTRVRAPHVEAKMPVFDAAEEEFRARGLTLRAEEVAQGMIVELARGPDGRVLWAFVWTEDQQHAASGIRHYADPLDTVGEQELLLAIFRRALGRDVRIRLNAFR